MIAMVYIIVIVVLFLLPVVIVGISIYLPDIYCLEKAGVDDLAALIQYPLSRCHFLSFFFSLSHHIIIFEKFILQADLAHQPEFQQSDLCLFLPTLCL